MKDVLITICLVGGLALQAQAQEVGITLMPASANMSACSAGDSTWSKKWMVTVSGDVATVSGGTPIRLKKVGAGAYEDILNLGNNGSFAVAFVDKGQGRSLKVTNKALGCIWQGTAP